MSEQLPRGYIYRVARADRERLTDIVKTYAGDNGWTFGGAAQWDFEPGRGQGNLRHIERISPTGAIDICGDFGHAFSDNAEVRWKRRDDDSYDVLILSEREQAIDGAQPLRVPEWNTGKGAWEDGDWRIRRYQGAAMVQVDKRPAIGYIDYLAPNGAVQFQRLLEVRS